MFKWGTYSYVVLVLLVLCTILPFLGSYHYLFDLMAHGRLLLSVTLFVFLLVFGLTKQMYHLIAAAVLLTVNIWEIRGFLTVSNNSDSSIDLKVMHINVLFDTDDFQVVKDRIVAHDPDVIGMLEITPEWLSQLQTLENYPYYMEHAMKGPFGLAIFSKFPLENQRLDNVAEFPLPVLSADITTEGSTVRVFACHTYPPISTGKFELRNAQMSDIGDLLRSTENWVAMGDFNCTPWSFQFKDFLQKSKGQLVTDNLAGTWPAGFPVQIPIDHILTSRNWSPRRVNTIQPTDSDHLGVVAELSLSVAATQR